MIVITKVQDLKNYLKNRKNIGFVPTMGALHLGHLSLIDKSKKNCDTTVVSIFVNPTQFLQGEDLRSYPRDFEEDRKKCEKRGVDILFYPCSEEIYCKDDIKIYAPKVLGHILEGERRSGHFDGVLTVVLKLFNIVKPQKAFFGEKDGQQLALIKKMTEMLFLDVEIVPCPIVREEDGLAMSSRNVYLSNQERQESLKIYKGLKKGKESIENGEENLEKIKKIMEKEFFPLEMEYISFRDRNFLITENVEQGNVTILVAGKVGKVRLLDNIKA